MYISIIFLSPVANNSDPGRYYQHWNNSYNFSLFYATKIIFLYCITLNVW
jgi:hypothetical protein